MGKHPVSNGTFVQLIASINKHIHTYKLCITGSQAKQQQKSSFTMLILSFSFTFHSFPERMCFAFLLFSFLPKFSAVQFIFENRICAQGVRRYSVNIVNGCWHSIAILSISIFIICLLRAIHNLKMPLFMFFFFLSSFLFLLFTPIHFQQRVHVNIRISCAFTIRVTFK